VIGQRDCGKAQSSRPGHDLARCALPIRSSRMEVKINTGRFAQRLYPVSGAVQAGCDMRK
jgi:hypothetical protein